MSLLKYRFNDWVSEWLLNSFERRTGICELRVLNLDLMSIRHQTNIIHFQDVFLQSLVLTMHLNIINESFLVDHEPINVLRWVHIINLLPFVTWFHLVIKDWVVIRVVIKDGLGHWLVEDPVVSSSSDLKFAILHLLEFFVDFFKSPFILFELDLSHHLLLPQYLIFLMDLGIGVNDLVGTVNDLLVDSELLNLLLVGFFVGVKSWLFLLLEIEH